MMKRFSKEQLEKLLIHTVGINSVLTDVLLGWRAESEEETEAGGVGACIDILVTGQGGRCGDSGHPEKETPDLDHLCGQWQGGRRKPDLLIFKASPGYMAAWGKKPKNGETGDCYLITDEGGKLRVSTGDGFVYLCYDADTDTLKLHPGGVEYKRAKADKK